MKPLTNSDQINIDTFKGLLNMLSNDIKDAKQGNTPQNVKADLVFKLSKQRANLLQNAKDNYPHINWITETLGEETGFKRAENNTFKLKALSKLKLI